MTCMDTINPEPLKCFGTCLEGDCTAPKESNTDFCGRHNFERRKAAKQALKPVKVKKPIKRVSEKRKEKLKEYTPLKEKYLEAFPQCEVRLTGCTKVAVEVHHCSMSDRDFLNTDTWKSSCRHCHTIIETVLSAEERKDMGLLTVTNSMNLIEKPTI